VDDLKRAGEPQQRSCRSREIADGEGCLLSRLCPGSVGRRRAGAGSAVRGVGDHPVEVLRRQKARREAQVAADELTAVFEGVGARVRRRMSRQILLELDADHPHRGVALREQQADHADAGPQIENPLAAARLAEVREQERVETVAVPARGLREDQTADQGLLNDPGRRG